MPDYKKDMQDPEYRRALIHASVRIGIPFEVRAQRTRRGWTQGVLAEKAGIRQPRVAEVENGVMHERLPSLKTLIKLAQAFDVELVVAFLPLEGGDEAMAKMDKPPKAKKPPMPKKKGGY